MNIQCSKNNRIAHIQIVDVFLFLLVIAVDVGLHQNWIWNFKNSPNPPLRKTCTKWCRISNSNARTCVIEVVIFTGTRLGWRSHGVRSRICRWSVRFRSHPSRHGHHEFPRVLKINRIFIDQTQLNFPQPVETTQLAVHKAIKQMV